LVKAIYKHVQAQQLSEQPYVEKDPRFIVAASADAEPAP
jgi:hypothetical protein